jgi:Tfp pilus assembly protein PilF
MPKFKLLISLLFGVGLLIAGAGCDLHTARTNGARLRLERTMAKTQLYVAEEFFEHGRVEQAEQAVCQSLQVSPEEPEAHLLMGKIHYVCSRYDNARESFLAALKFDEDLQQAKDFLELLAQMEEQQANIDVLRTDPIALKQ